MIAVDTNVWVYSFDQAETQKHDRAWRLLEQVESSDECVTLWQVLSELTNVLRRWETRGILTAKELEDSVGHVVERFPIITPQHTTVLTALDLSRRYYLSHWDSMLLAACLEAGVTTLYSEDLSHNAYYDSVLVKNPFAAE